MTQIKSGTKDLETAAFIVPAKIGATNFCDAKSNLLLRALPEEDYKRLAFALEFVELARDEVLYHSGDEIRFVYFPLTAIVSRLYTTECGSTAEMGIVGRCGIIGTPVFLGGRHAPNQAIVQVAGAAFRVRAKTICEEFARGGALQRTLLSYTQYLLTQVSQIAVCNRLHTFEQRLCRWLLFCHDCVMKDEIVLTQEMLSHLLGVRREGVTVAAGKLQDAKLISYVRGHIHVLDREGLERSCCECYEVVRDEYQRLLA